MVPYNFSAPQYLVNLIRACHSYVLGNSHISHQVWLFVIHAWVGYDFQSWDALFFRDFDVGACIF